MTGSRRLRFFWVLMLVLLANACGRDHDTRLGSTQIKGVPNGEWSKSAKNRHPIAGAWRSDCSSTQPPTRTELRIFDDRSLLITVIFSDQNCLQRSTEGIWVINSIPVAMGANVWTLDASQSKLIDALTVPTSKVVAEAWNANVECGIKDWKVNRAQSILGTQCQTEAPHIGTITLLRSLDPSLLQIRFPGVEKGLWLKDRSKI